MLYFTHCSILIPSIVTVKIKNSSLKMAKSKSKYLLTANMAQFRQQHNKHLANMIIHNQHPDSCYIIQPLIYEESIEFRAYQKNIAESAYDKNTLVVLPTALGRS